MFSYRNQYAQVAAWMVLWLGAVAGSTAGQGDADQARPVTTADILAIDLDLVVQDEAVSEELRLFITTLDTLHAQFETTREIEVWKPTLLALYKRLDQYGTRRALILTCMLRTLLCQAIAVELQSEQDEDGLLQLDAQLQQIAMKPSDLNALCAADDEPPGKDADWDTWIAHAFECIGVADIDKWLAVSSYADARRVLGRFGSMEDVALGRYNEPYFLMHLLLLPESQRAVTLRGTIAYLLNGGSRTSVTGDSVRIALGYNKSREFSFAPLKVQNVTSGGIEWTLRTREQRVPPVLAFVRTVEASAERLKAKDEARRKSADDGGLP